MSRILGREEIGMNRAAVKDSLGLAARLITTEPSEGGGPSDNISGISRKRSCTENLALFWTRNETCGDA